GGGDFEQTWTNVVLTNDDWSQVRSVVGYRGDNQASATGVDPRNITSGSVATVVDVNVGTAGPNTFTTGGVTYFNAANGVADPTIALQGSGTARAPNIVLFLNGTGRENVHLDLDLRDIDGSGDNAAQQVA